MCVSRVKLYYDEARGRNRPLGNKVAPINIFLHCVSESTHSQLTQAASQSDTSLIRERFFLKQHVRVLFFELHTFR